MTIETENTLDDMPRGLYFKAEDRAHWKTHPSISSPKAPDRLGIERSRRSQKAAAVIDTAQAVINAVRSIRAFDATGHTLDALPHMDATLQDLIEAAKVFTDDVEAAADRWEEAQVEASQDPNPVDRVVSAHAKRQTMIAEKTQGGAAGLREALRQLREEQAAGTISKDEARERLGLPAVTPADVAKLARP